MYMLSGKNIQMSYCWQANGSACKKVKPELFSMESAVGTLADNQHVLDALPGVDNDPVVAMNLLIRQA